MKGKVMAKLWERISKSLFNGVTVAAEKTEEFTKLGKAKLEILNAKRKISKSFTELGGITYDAIKTEKTKEFLKTSEVEELVNTIKELEADLDSKEETYGDLKKKTETKEN